MAVAGSEPTGEITLARRGVAALELLNDLPDGADLTPEQRAVLAGWTGWGPLAKALEYQYDGPWVDLSNRVGKILSYPARETAKNACDTAFYTPATVVAAMWDLVTGLGFQGGRALEPGCGSGRFIAAAPADLELEWTGVEADEASAAVARLLHPTATIMHKRLEKTPLPYGQAGFDLAIGNVPFSAQGVYDPTCPKAVDSLHGYFLWRALSAVRPGGLVVAVTSRWTLDAQDPEERAELAKLGVFLGAIRLPGDALAPGGTRAVTDIVVFRRRTGTGEPHVDDKRRAAGSWLDLASTPAGLKTTVSRYFQVRPSMVAGMMADRGGQRYGMTLAVTLPPGETLAAALDDRVQHLIAASRQAGLAGWLPRSGGLEIPVWDGPSDPAAEGSFTLHDDGRVTVQRDGIDVLVPRPDRELTALILLKTLAVALFAAEADEGMGANERNRIRQAAMRGYQAYTAAYGYLGRCDITERPDPDEPGEVIITRRRPAMGGFRGDPDWPTLLALEVWDDDAGTGHPAPVLTRHVNARPKRKEHTDDPGEALLLCLDETGQVDLDVIARILRTAPADVPRLLGTAIWRDPQTMDWVTQDEYLSGNVRAKLAYARSAGEGWEGNAAALESVQPEDLGPDEINVQLGAPWIPPDVIERFTAEILGFDWDRDWNGRRITVRYEPLTATWEVKGTTSARKQPQATSTWGTTRVNAVSLIEDACNGVTPVVNDIIDSKPVRNREETALAADKIRDLQERFGCWVWEDPARTEILAAIYNNRFNCTRVRTYDGSLLTFPGLTGTFHPYPHQVDMVWRNVCVPTTLCGHVVGAGKTWVAVATAMTLRRLGMVRKPAMTVPNHLLEQTCAEARRYYPGAKILMVTADDLTPARRRYFAAKVAARDWDLVVMTHQQFGALPVHPDTQEAYFCGLMDDLDQALQSDVASESRATAKMLARKRKQLQAKLDALADMRRDAGLTFEQTGIDCVIVDEAHYFKNLQFTARAEGFNQSGSKRADDLLMKITWLRGRNPDGRTGMLMTGTPISNALSELHVLFRYCAPELLEDQQIGSFDAFAAQYIRYEWQTEVDPSGAGFRSYRRPRRFVNLAELRSMLWQFADIRGRDQLNLDGPKVTVEHVVVPPPPEMAEFIAGLVARADRIRAGGVNPREDNMLKVCGAGRAAALWLAMVNVEATGPGKIEQCAQKVARIYHDTAGLLYDDPAGLALYDPAPGGFQVVFCDQGTPDSWDYGVYSRLTDLLTEAGVPRKRIAFIHDAKTHEARAGLFARCRSGEISVLLGSTEKMGTGVNVQRRMVAIHHLDAPWRPADIEQRDGRGDRPGNQNPELQVYRYATEGSFDSYMWQALERKARFISQVLTGDPHVREVEAVDNPAVLSYGELKALATGQPLLLMLSEVNNELARLRLQAAGHKRSQTAMRIDRYQQEGRAEAEHAAAEEIQGIGRLADLEAVPVFKPEYGGDKAEGAEAAGPALTAMLAEARQTRKKDLYFRWRNVHVHLGLDPVKKGPPIVRCWLAPYYRHTGGRSLGLHGHLWHPDTGGATLLEQVDAEIGQADTLAQFHLDRKADALRRIEDLAPYLDQPFPHTAELARLLARRDEIQGEIDAQVKDSRPVTAGAV